MSQELQVVQCFACETYQTQIVKKLNKWICKICGEKQSLKKVFGQGSGKDCRIHCQRLNELRRNKLENESSALLNVEESSAPVQEEGKVDMASPLRGASKWSKYLSQQSNSDDDDDGDLFDLRASQFVLPQCTPQSVGISQVAPEPFEQPSVKRLKTDDGRAVAEPKALMDSDDDECFTIDLPPSAEAKAFPSIVTSPLCSDKETQNKTLSFFPKQKTVLQVPDGEFSTINSASGPSSTNRLTCENSVFKEKPSKNTNQQSSFPKQTNGEMSKVNFDFGLEDFLDPQPIVTCEKKAKEQVMISKQPIVEVTETDFKKNVSAKPFAKSLVRDLKRAISLFEDIDNYSLEQLTKMCDF